MRNLFRQGITLLSLTCLLMPGCSLADEDQRKPNIIFILADDLSYRDLSCYGQKLYSTPNLDMLANDGLVFNQAYSAAPECAPARGSLMTGLHTGHGTIRRNSSARGQEYLKEEDITVAEELKKLGYATGFTGKWGIGQPGTEGVPYKQGFDVAFGYYDQVRAHTFFPEYLWENDKKVEYPGNKGFDMTRRYNFSRLPAGTANYNVYDTEGKLVLDELPEPDKAVYSQAEVEKAAIRFLDTYKDQPFFLYFAPQLPHGPVIVDDFSPMMALDTIPQLNREWAAMVIRLDKIVG